MIKICLVVILTVISLSRISPQRVGGCSCQIPHPQVEICSDTINIAIKAKTLKENLIPKSPIKADKNVTSFYWRRYQIKVLAVFKGSSLLSSNAVKYVFTNADTDKCGVKFNIGVKYLITGSFKDGKFLTGECAWNPQWGKLTTHQKLSYKKGRYTRNCGCKIPSRRCKIPKSRYMCYHLFATCVSKSKGKCGWKIGGGIKKCLR